MKRLLQIYGFVVLATTLLLALLKFTSFPGITWGWVALPILGPFVLWLLFIGLVTTVGLVWPAPKPLNLRHEKYRVEKLRVDRDFRHEQVDSFAKMEQKEAYYRKALALELATLAHDTPGFIEWEKQENRLIGELKILVKNELP